MHLETASADEQFISDNSELDDGSWAGDRKLYVEFRKEWSAHPNQEKSAKEGRPVFDEVEYVKVTSPGDRNNIVDHPVTDYDRARFRALYKQWRDGQKTGEGMQGTPVEKWPELTRADAEGLRYLHIYTVEQLVSLDDNVLGKHPGLRSMQTKARQWLDVATRTAAASQLRRDKEAAEASQAAMKAQLEEANRRLAALEERLTAPVVPTTKGK